MNIPFDGLEDNLTDMDIRKGEAAASVRLDTSLRIGRRVGAGSFAMTAWFFPTSVMDRGYRDRLRRWLEGISLLGNYSDVPLSRAELDTLSTTRTGTTAWDSQRQQFVITLTANDSAGVGTYVNIVYNGTTRLFVIDESITARRKVLWPNVHVGTVTVSPASLFRCYGLPDDVDIFVGMGQRLSEVYEVPLYEHIG